MSIYIDNGKTVKHYCTNKKTDKAIETLLEQNEELVYSETHEGYEVKITDKDYQKSGGYFQTIEEEVSEALQHNETDNSVFNQFKDYLEKVKKSKCLQEDDIVEEITDEICNVFQDIKTEMIERNEDLKVINLLDQLMYVACGVVYRVSELEDNLSDESNTGSEE